MHPWDVAAAKLIAVEAGAKTGYYSAERNISIPDCINGNSIIVSSPGILMYFKRLSPTNRIF